MDSLESLVAMLLTREGYWTGTSVKVELTKAEKRKIGRPTSPRWEIDVVAFKGRDDELLAVECKSLLNSRGVLFRNGGFESTRRYKLFSDSVLRSTVLRALKRQFVRSGACPSTVKTRLALAAGNIATSTDLKQMRRHFKKRHWRLFEPVWMYDHLMQASNEGYEDDVAFYVSKILNRYNCDE